MESRKEKEGEGLAPCFAGYSASGKRESISSPRRTHCFVLAGTGGCWTVRGEVTPIASASSAGVSCDAASSVTRAPCSRWLVPLHGDGSERLSVTAAPWVVWRRRVRGVLLTLASCGQP